MDERQTLPYWKSQLDEIWLEQMTFIHKGKNLDEIIGYAFADLLSQPDRLKTADGSDFKRLVNSWLSNKRPETKKNGLTKITEQQQRANALIAAKFAAKETGR